MVSSVDGLVGAVAVGSSGAAAASRNCVGSGHRGLDAFEGRRLLIAYYFMWHTGPPAPKRCEGCTWDTSQVRELSYIHSRDVTFAVLCQGPYEALVLDDEHVR
jgi:predicted dithiol-disulfide oxidoreductase (DUF899 family)